MDINKEVHQPPDYFSNSQLGLANRCMRAYYLSKICGHEEKPSYPLICGSSGHKALEEDGQRLIDGKAPMNHKQIVEAAVGAFEDRVEELDGKRGDWVDAFVGDVRPCLGEYVHKRPIAEVPLAVEKRYDVSLWGQKFVAIIDAEYPDLLVDYKFLKRRKSAKDVNTDPQMIIYHAITGLQPAFIQLIKGKDIAQLVKPELNPKVVSFVKAWAMDTMDAIEVAKENDCWPRCSPTNWWCGETCAHYYQCFGGQNEG